jgi:RpiB/LacA/LacB family sugar-phosphate isomerase
LHIEIGCDHRGYELKERLIRYLREHGNEVTDRGCDSADASDYPDHGYAVARAVAARKESAGILICSNGIGMSMVANKVQGVRAALCVTPAMASQSRRHNDANVLVLGAANVSTEENLRILEAWLEASFEGGRHQRRVDKIAQGECRHPHPET